MDEKQKVKLLVEEYFKEKDKSNENQFTFSTTGDDYYQHAGVPSTFFNMNQNARFRNKYSDDSDDYDSNSDMYWVFLTYHFTFMP